VWAFTIVSIGCRIALPVRHDVSTLSHYCVDIARLRELLVNRHCRSADGRFHHHLSSTNGAGASRTVRLHWISRGHRSARARSTSSDAIATVCQFLQDDAPRKIEGVQRVHESLNSPIRF